MRLTLDTNILISALGWKGGPEYQIVQKCIQQVHKLVLSPEILAEFKKVAVRPKFDFDLEEIDEYINAILEACDLVLPEERIYEIKDDPKDNIILEAAVTGNVQYIISGDKHLLNLGEFRDISIVQSSKFLSVLKSSS